MAFAEHPLRRWAVNEMHLRRFAPVAERCDIYQVVRLLEPHERAAEDRWLIAYAPPFDEWNLAPRHGSGSCEQQHIFLVGTAY